MSYKNLRFDVEGAIGTITLNRPEKRNAVTVEMLTGICEMAERQAADPDVRAILPKGEGKIFSSGLPYRMPLLQEPGGTYGP